MPSDSGAVAVSKKGLWAGRILSGLVVLFLIPDGIIKFIKPAPVVDAFAHLGLPLSSSVTLGILLLTCTVLYAIPRTSVLGAIRAASRAKSCGGSPSGCGQSRANANG